jgi:ribonuclease HI
MGIEYHSWVKSHASKAENGASRTFKPDELYWQGVALDIIENTSRDHIWTCVACDKFVVCPHCGRLAIHGDSVSIAVDGACRNNGRTNARASIGVFVADDSLYNVSKLFSDANLMNQRAELAAGLMGLTQALAIKTHAFEDLSFVVIKADSEYLVKGMTEWVFKWKSNGYRNVKGTEVVNGDLFEALERKVEELNGLGVEVRFWHVPRDWNQDVDGLANEALDA